MLMSFSRHARAALLSGQCACVLLTPAAPMAAEDWPMWGGTPARNMVATAPGSIPLDFEPGQEIGRTGVIDPETTKHIKWIAKLGSQTYGNVVVAQGKVLIGTNNAAPRDPKYKGDRSVLLCLDEQTGELVWQLNLPKLGSGKVGDWEYLGICSSPAVVGDTVYVVTNLCEVVALDLHGLSNGNRGVTDEAQYVAGPGNPPIEQGPKDADVLWRYDMTDELGVFPHNISSNSPMVVDGVVYVGTSNGVDWSHVNIVNPQAPAMIGVNAATGELVGEEGAGISRNLLHCNWSSPAFAKVGEQPTIIFGGGDGWLYGFNPKPVKDEDDFDIFPVLWKIDGNPAHYRVDENGEPIRYATAPGPSEYIATPVYHDGLIYIAIGQDPEHGEGVGSLICVDPSQVDEDGKPKLVWRDNTIERSISTVSVHDGLVFAADYSGNLHCYDAKTGQLHWTHNTMGHIWSSTLVADGKVLIGNEDGILTILEAGKEKKLLAEIEFGSPIYSTPVLANGVLYVSTQTHLYAIAADATE